MSVSVYNYTDFRKYLSDYFEYRRQKNPNLLFKDISFELGMKSPSYTTLILQGKANISKKAISNVVKFCRLKKLEAAYFKTMVLFNQTKNHEDKKAHFEKLVSFKLSCVYKFNTNDYQYFDKWYYSAIRSLTASFNIRDNYAEVSTMLVPSIRDYQVRQAVKLLEDLNLIALNEEGYYRATSVYLDTGKHAMSTVVNDFVIAMLDKAKESLDRFPNEDRKLSWITFNVTRQGYDRIVTEMRNFRLKVADIIEEETADTVYQLNMQLFPLSKSGLEQINGDLTDVKEDV
ncbi:MAG: TIGR02147 family protein [Fibrobacteria bacterium]|nr:TIGR02147 family protein [Fibrobacteria bacterium]